MKPRQLGVVPDNLLMDGAAPPRPDQAVRETAALMHDIGKVKTPNEILNKPDKLTGDEFAIMKRHVVDGAEILRGTPEMPSLAPIVALEDHLRLDGTGYPHGVTRPTLNLATMLSALRTCTTRCDRSASTSRHVLPRASWRYFSATTASSSINISFAVSYSCLESIRSAISSS